MLAAMLPMVLLALLIGGGTLVFATLMVKRPGVVAMGLVALFCVASQPSTYGLGAPSPLGLFYTMGANTFYLSLLQIFVLMLWGICLFLLPKPVDALGQRPWTPLFAGYALFALIILGWLLADPAEWFSVPWLKNILWANAVHYVVWQGIIIYTLYTALHQRADLRRVGKVMLVALTLNHLWGMFRYVVLGGDPQNAYATMEKLSVKITFWDINDSVLGCFLVGYCIWWLLARPHTRGGSRWLHVLVLLLGLASVVLSSRRTAQLGLVFALAGVVLCLPRGKRGLVILVATLMIPLALIVTAQRSRDQSGSLIDRVMLDAKHDRFEDPRQSRFYEWKRAWMTIRENPVLGLGPKGSFNVIDDEGLKYHKRNFAFMHSGWGHILLKTGFVGLSIYLSILGFLIFKVARAWSGIPVSLKPLGVGAIASLFASLPNFTVGTPVIEIRTMWVIGMMMALLMQLVRLSKPRPAAVPEFKVADPYERPTVYAKY